MNKLMILGAMLSLILITGCNSPKNIQIKQSELPALEKEEKIEANDKSLQVATTLKTADNLITNTESANKMLLGKWNVKGRGGFIGMASRFDFYNDGTFTKTVPYMKDDSFFKGKWVISGKAPIELSLKDKNGQTVASYNISFHDNENTPLHINDKTMAWKDTADGQIYYPERPYFDKTFEKAWFEKDLKKSPNVNKEVTAQTLKDIKKQYEERSNKIGESQKYQPNVTKPNNSSNQEQN